ncbi:MAG: hypothetical protein LBI13_06725 [Streptococcaceae bacterium]|jgi:hypothetical protein|nr:hypothetical protein [Streptococcaceae bacterium]
MGNKYISSDISALASGLSAQSKRFRTTIEDFKKPFAALINDVTNNTLSGKTWDGVSGVIREIFQVAFRNLETGLDELDSGVIKLTQAQSTVRFAEIDEGQAKDSLTRINIYIAQLEQSAQNYNNPIIASDAQERLPSIYAQRTQIENALNDLSAFISATAGIFDEPIASIQNAISLIQQIRGGGFDSSGQYLNSKHYPIAVKKLSDEDIEKENQIENTQLQKDAEVFYKLYKNNPAKALEEVENNPELFNYLISIMDKIPNKAVQDALLNAFIVGEKWNSMPKKVAEILIDSPRFALAVKNLTSQQQYNVYSGLQALKEKGWDVLNPIGYIASVLKDTSFGAKVADGLGEFSGAIEKVKIVANFIKENPWIGKSISYGGFLAVITSNAFEEYSNPESPAYGNMDMAVYGGLNKFLYEAGPIEGLELGGPVGAMVGTVNTVVQAVVPGSNERNWLDEQYKNYGQPPKNQPSANTSYPGYGVTPNDPGPVQNTQNNGNTNSNQGMPDIPGNAGS